jgi:hypothetical protein
MSPSQQRNNIPLRNKEILTSQAYIYEIFPYFIKNFFPLCVSVCVYTHTHARTHINVLLSNRKVYCSHTRRATLKGCEDHMQQPSGHRFLTPVTYEGKISCRSKQDSEFFKASHILRSSEKENLNFSLSPSVRLSRTHSGETGKFHSHLISEFTCPCLAHALWMCQQSTSWKRGMLGKIVTIFVKKYRMAQESGNRKETRKQTCFKLPYYLHN